jgi:hypothetical protein
VPVATDSANRKTPHGGLSGIRFDILIRRLQEQRCSSASFASRGRPHRARLSHNGPFITEYEICEQQHVTQHDQGASDGNGLQISPTKKNRGNSASENNRPENPDTNMDARDAARIKGWMQPVKKADKKE